jgi:hypothetical protein
MSVGSNICGPVATRTGQVEMVKPVVELNFE